MDSLLQEITMLPGVLGCFAYTGKQQIASSKMPPIFKENSLKTIGSLISRTVQMSDMAQLDLHAIEIKLNESLLIIKPLSKGGLLIIVCEPSANKSLITMTMEMLSKDIEASMAKGVIAPSASQTPPRPKPAAPTKRPPAQAPPKEAEIDANLATVLEKINDALAMAIGPIAGPVMKDTIETWSQQGPTTPSNLPALAKLLCQEINDNDLEQEFMVEFKKILS